MRQYINYARLVLTMILPRLALLFLLAFTCWLFFWNLGSSSISLRSDEVIYVRVTQSVLHSGDIFPLKHGNIPTFEKPPLKLWLGAIAPFILGESNLSFRLLDGVCGVASIVLTVTMMRMISGSLWLGILSGVLLLGMPELVISHHGFRRAVLDGLLTVLTILGAYGSWKIIEARARGESHEALTRRSIVIGLIFSLAVLTKSVAGFVPALCAVAAWFVTGPSNISYRMRHMITERAWVWIVALPVCAFVAYCGALWFFVGPKALNIFIGVEILTRTLSGFEGHNTDNRWFYLWSLFIRGSTVPRALLAVGLCGALIGMRQERHLRFLLVWVCLPVTLYSLAASKVPWYLNPFLPCISMLAVAGSSHLLTRVRRKTGVTIARFGLVFLAIASIPAYARAVIRNVESVIASDFRIEIDTFVESLRKEYSHFVILENAIPGRSNPRNGRFNVEGIYRETLRPHLRTLPTLEGFSPVANEVVLVKEGSLEQLPPGWRKLGAAPPLGTREWVVVAVVYAAQRP